MKKKLKRKIGQAILYLLFNAMGSGMLFYGLMTATTLN